MNGRYYTADRGDVVDFLRSHGPFNLALDIGCSAVDLCGLIPWCIACSVPLKIMGVGVSALPFSFLLYLLPLTFLARDRIKAKKTAEVQ